MIVDLIMPEHIVKAFDVDEFTAYKCVDILCVNTIEELKKKSACNFNELDDDLETMQLYAIAHLLEINEVAGEVNNIFNDVYEFMYLDRGDPKLGTICFDGDFFIASLEYMFGRMGNWRRRI